MEGSGTGRSYKPPELPVRSILNDYALQHETPELNVRTEIRNLSKFRASRKGRIRVNKEVLAILQQISSELDAAQQHYLAYKQFGDAGESLLKLSPELFFLPSDGAAEAGAGDDEQDAAAADVPGGTATSGAGAQNLLVGHRRWGYFSLLNKLKPVSAQRKPPPPPQQQFRSSISDVAATAADAAAEPEDWAEPDTPKASWAELMRQKKRAKEDGIAHMVRVRHAVLVIQRAWRRHLQKRASRALAMMMLRAKVRRAHRAAYVSNLLRRKTPGMSSSSGGETTGEGGGSLENAPNEEDIQLTPQQEAELQEALQRVLEEGNINISDIAELQLTELMGRLNCNRDDSPAGSSVTLAIGSGESSSESEEEAKADEQQQGGWKSISTPKAPAKRPAGLRIDTETPASSSWQDSLRTPGGSLRTNSRLGTPDLDLARRGIIRSGSHRQGVLGSSTECSPRGSSESCSPRTPGCFGGPDSPKRASISRRSLTSAGGVRVGKRMSVVLADAENAVAIAHGSGNVVVRAKSAARQGHHNVSRLNPAAGTRTSVIADIEQDSPSFDGNICSSVEAAATAQSEQQLLLPGAAGGRGSIQRSSLGNQTTAAATSPRDLGHPISSRRTSRVSFNDEIDYIGRCKVETALPAAACSLTNDAVAAAVAAGFAAARAAAAVGGGADVCNGYTGESNVGQEWQRQLAQQWHEQCGSPIPDGLVQSLAVAAAQAGLQAGSQGWLQAMHQMQQHAMQQILQQQQQVELQQQLGQAGDSMITSAATVLLVGRPEGQSCGPGTAVVDAAAAAVAAITAVLGSGNNSPIPSGASQASHSANSRSPGNSRHGYVSSPEPVAGGAHAAAEGSSVAAAGVPHYASPLPPRSSSPGRRCSSSSPEDGHRVDDSSLLPARSRPGGTAASRRATREGGTPSSRGFVTTSSGGAAFSKYERGLGDGLQQDYRAIAAEALLAESWGPAAPPHPRRPCKVQSSDGSSRQSPVGEHSGGGRPRTRFSNEGFATEHVQQHKEEEGVEELQQQQLLLGVLQQQLLDASRGLPDLSSLDGPVDFSFVGDGQSQHALQYIPDSEFDPVAATAAVATSMEQYNAAAAAAATAAAGQAGPLMQGLVLSQAGMCQQQQGQQQMRADGWYERLVARKKSVRQPWDPPASTNGSNVQQQGLGDGSGKGLAEQGGAGSHDVEFPTGHWGRRGQVHNAWLFIDGRQAAALPWQALAAATAAGSGVDGSNAAAATAATAKSAESAALDAAAAFMEPNAALGRNRLKQLSVQGKKLLVKLMWMKSAARVLRSLGKNVGLSQVLERKVLTAVRNNTGPAGKQLLVWSVDDQQKQGQQQQQQQLMLCMQLQQQLLMLLQQQRLGELAPSVGIIAAGSLQHFYQLPGGMIGLNPFLDSSQQHLSPSGDVVGQHLPLLPAARARALLGKPLPAGQHQHQQLLWLLAQQQLLLQQQQQQQPEKVGGLVAAQCQQLTAAIAAAAAPAMGDQQQQQGEWSPLQMQQLLQAQQRVWQQQQQQGGKGAQAPHDGYKLASDSRMGEVPMVKKLVLARRFSRADALAAGASGSCSAAAAASAGTPAATTTGCREHGSAAVADDAIQPVACEAGIALQTPRACAILSCSGASAAADTRAAALQASHIQSPGDSSSSSSSTPDHLAQQQKGKAQQQQQQQQEFQWLQPLSAPALPQPAGSLQVLVLKQQQQGKQVGQQPLSASWSSAVWQDVGKASGAQTDGPQQQQQCSAFILAQEQQQGEKAASFQQQQQQPTAVVMADDSSSIPAGAMYVSFVTSTKFQPRMHGKPRRWRTDGSSLPSVGSGSAGALGAAATAIPNAANRQHYLRGSSTGAVAAAATVGMHVQRVNLGYPAGSNAQGLPSLAGSTQQQLQLQYQQQQQQWRQGLAPGFFLQPQQHQQFQQPAKSAGTATGLQQQQRLASSELDSEGIGSVLSGWSVQAARRRSSRLSTSDPGSPALLADVQAAKTAAAVAGSNVSYSSETPHQQQAGVSSRKGHHKPAGVLQCTGRQANGAGTAAAVRWPQPVAGVDCGTAAATGGRQRVALQHAVVALHQMQPQLPQLAPLRVATDLSPVGSLTQAKCAEGVAVVGAVHSKQVLPTIFAGISPVTQH